MNNFRKAVGIIAALFVSVLVTIGLNKGLLNVFGKEKTIYNPDTGDAEVSVGYFADDIIPFVIFFACLVLISVIAEKIIKK